MFNVTILKMKDIIKYIVGIIITVTIIALISKQFPKEKNNNEGKIVNEIKNGINMLSEQSFINCFEQTVPYSKVAKEDNHNKNNCKYHIFVNFIFRVSNIEKEMNKNK